MKIVLAQHAGFCFGVKRATAMAFEAVEGAEGDVCSLGPIIHSPQLVERLAQKGVRVVERVEDLPDARVIVRSHGVTAEELGNLQQRGIKIIDATCPFVKKAQEYAALLGREGYDLVLVGEAEHPEVQGIVSYARGGEGQVFVVGSRAEAEKIPVRRRIGVVAQTTQSEVTLNGVVDVCLGKCRELRVFNTICDATAVRQEEAARIAREVELMLVIGGHNSANTNRLARICEELQPRTRHIETAAELRPDWFSGVETVGITAGASTPRWIIDEVLERITTLGKSAK